MESTNINDDPKHKDETEIRSPGARKLLDNAASTSATMAESSDIDSEIRSLISKTASIAQQPVMQQNTIQVSADIFSSLAASIKDLRHEVALLRTQRFQLMHQIAGQDATLPPLQSFTLFPKLPVEIQIRIWMFALSVPQVIGVEAVCNSDRNLYLVPRTNHSPLLLVNRQSRKEASKVQKQYHNLFEISNHLSPNYRMQAPEIFPNLQIDTIWLINAGSEHDLECDIQSVFRPATLENSSLPGCISSLTDFLPLGWYLKHQECLRSIAIPYNYWYDLTTSYFGHELEFGVAMEQMFSLGPLKEIIILVSKFQCYVKQEVCLVNPSYPPHACLPRETFDLGASKWMEGTSREVESKLLRNPQFVTWSELEREAQEFVEAFKESRALNLEALITDPDLTEDEMAEETFENPGPYMDCSNWVIPKFLFREVVPMRSNRR